MGSFTAALQRFGIGRLAAVLGVAAGVTAVLVAVMMRMGEAPNALLYSNLDLREAAEITEALDQAGITYDARGDGSTIMVHRDEVGTARLLLASRGLVTSGSVGYELFDTQSALGQTEFQQNLNRKRAIEGEIARTLMAMRGVNSARVMIALPERQLFQAEPLPVTASVTLDVGGRELSGEEVAAIQQLVATAVTGLRPDRVTIVDTNNRLLAAGGEGEGFSSAAAADRRAETEARLRATILDIVEGVVGPGQARVQVTAEIDESTETVREEEFNPDGQVVRSTSTGEVTSESNDGGDAGLVTATENIPDGLEGEAEAGFMGPTNRSGETREITNYEISNTVRTTVRNPGTIRRLSVAVAVNGVLAAPEGGGEATYEPRSEEDMQRIEQLVRSAAGISTDRGDQLTVTNIRFPAPGAAADGGTAAGGGLFDFDKNDLMRGAELLILLVVGLLLIFFVVRPLLKTAGVGKGGEAGGLLSGPGGGSSGGLALPGGGGQAALAGGAGMAALTGPSEMDNRIDIARIEGQVKASSVKKVADFVDSNPDESISILRNWVHEG